MTFQEGEEDIETWRILNLIRGLCAILGWLVISLRPNTDKLSKSIFAHDPDLFGEEHVKKVDDLHAI